MLSELVVFLLQPFHLVLLFCHKLLDFCYRKLLLLDLLRKLLDNLVLLLVLDELQLKLHYVLFQVEVLLVYHFKQCLLAVRFCEVRFLPVCLYADEVL